jgi:hypothetical protein
MDSGITFGVTSNNYICRDCNYQGMPIIFKSEKEYKLFLDGLLQEIKSRVENKKEDQIKSSEDVEVKLSKTDEEIIDYLKDLIDEEIDFESEYIEEEEVHWHGNRSWWIEIAISFGISAIIFLSVLPYLITQMNMVLFFYYTLLFFLEALFILAGIVVIEYFVLFKFIKKK